VCVWGGGDLSRKGIISAARHVLPHHQAKRVGMIVPSTWLDLLVLPDGVEPHAFECNEIIPQCFIGRCRVVSFEGMSHGRGGQGLLA
jgi:hypothetical protein